MKKAVKKVKIQENELLKVQSMMNAFNQLKMQLGDIELSKVSVIENINKLKADYMMVEKDLAKVYGADAQIDVKTGEVSEKPKEPKLEKIK
jgi:archaellum component FlaC|tara:strand:+ start:78 stop:350 length:273 start_codon:yes stop_codon:yes gene_type:complete